MDYSLLKRNFEAHGFLTSFYNTKEEAAEYLRENIKNTAVAIGGSVTATEMGLGELLSECNDVIWHWNRPGRERLLEARLAEVYICSANGISETGELVNIDGTGNRVSMTLFGPEKLYIIAGKNKIVPDLKGAIDRAKNIDKKLYKSNTNKILRNSAAYSANHFIRI